MSLFRKSGKSIEGLENSSTELLCSACGSKQLSSEIRHCVVCKKNLSEGYQPLDSFRSSYHLHGKKLWRVEQNPIVEESLFPRDRNSASDVAWASFVYSMVPYLGIIFIPFTIVSGLYAISTSKNNPQLGGLKMARVATLGSVVMLGFQIFLWWLLYVIPDLGRQIP